MDIQEKETLIAEIERFKEEAMKSYVVSCWAESYTNTDPFGYVILKNENNKVWWLKTQAYQLWEMWQAAKAQAVPEGFVLVKDKPVAYMVQNKFWNGEFEVKLLSEMPEPEFDGDSYDIEIPLYAIEAQEQAND